MITMLLVLALIGCLAWVLVTYVPMPQPVKVVIIVFAAIWCAIMALHSLGVY